MESRGGKSARGIGTGSGSNGQVSGVAYWPATSVSGASAVAGLMLPQQQQLQQYQQQQQQSFLSQPPPGVFSSAPTSDPTTNWN